MTFGSLIEAHVPIFSTEGVPLISLDRIHIHNLGLQVGKERDEMSWTGFFSRSSSGATSSSPSAIVPHAHRQRMKQIENLREQVNG